MDELIADVGFRDRASILKRLVDRRAETEAQKDDIRKLLQEAERLCDRRNVIVHNPWTIWIDFDAQDFMTEIQRYSNRAKKVDLKELRDFTESVGDLERRLREALRGL